MDSLSRVRNPSRDVLHKEQEQRQKQKEQEKEQERQRQRQKRELAAMQRQLELKDNEIRNMSASTAGSAAVSMAKDAKVTGCIGCFANQ